MNPGINATSRVAAPPSDTRSFTEESQIFHGAGLGTPRPGSRDSRQETPSSRRSSRIASRNASAVPRTGPKADPINEVDEDEDELAAAPNLTAPAQPPRSPSAGVSRGAASKTFIKSSLAPQNRDSSDELNSDEPDSDELESDEEEDTPKPPTRPTTNPQQARNAMAGTQNFNANQPIPNNFQYGQFMPRGPNNSSMRPASQPGRLGDPAPGLPQLDGHFRSAAPTGQPASSAQFNPFVNQPRNRRPEAFQVPHGYHDQQDDEYDFPGVGSIISDTWDRITHLSEWPRWLVTGLQIWGLLALFSVAFLVLLQVFVPSNRWEGVKVSRNYTYTGLADWRQNIAQFVPWIILHPFAVLTGNLDYADFRTALHWAEWNHQNNRHRLDYLAGATHQMRRILPELIAINVDRSTNEWAVGDSFWFALDEQMRHGGLHHSILTLEKSADGSYLITDDHWDAILRRMQSEGGLIADRSAVENFDNVDYSDQITAVVERTVSQRWDQWLKKNDDATKRVQGADREAMSAYYTELFGDFEQKLLDRVRSYNQEEQLVSKDEFIEKIKHVSNEYNVQIKAEMEAMHDQLRYAIDAAEQSKRTARVPDGMSRDQVREMIDGAIQRAIADAQLESIAKGNIKGQVENELSGHKNYFSAVRGAMIDHSLSSSTYRWSNKGGILDVEEPRTSGGLFSLFSGKSTSVFRDGGNKAGIDYSAGKVLEKWDEDGECWCAGHADSNNNNDSRIADLSILTTDTVIPQHLVVEHITASGSFDPEAMPKDLEVWIRTPSDRRRRTLLEWSANIWSDARFEKNGARLMAKGFVKIGEFRYLSSVGKGEKQVFRLSEDLLDLDAQTQQVVVRSKSNYGAQDHTCFYRLQLFGKEGKALDRGVAE